MELGFYRQYLRTRSMAWRRAKEKDILKKKKKNSMQHVVLKSSQIFFLCMYRCKEIGKQYIYSTGVKIYN